MIEDIKKDAGQRMRKSVDALRQDLTKLRTGRAHTSLLDHVTVAYYGTDVPLYQVASISVADARTLMITPFEKGMVQPVEKAIMSSDLGLNPSTAGNVIRVVLPALTEERRKEMVRVVRQEAEGARVAVRNIRRDAIADLKELEKTESLSEDEIKRAQDEVQKLTDQYVARVDEVLAEKEKELMSV
ncbi:MAG TPA: ribosome recycling factor [Gammaproteobacteria bacterium]|nr:ribosome recycling factor [Gammaproteobacteria bacterium]